MGYVQRLSKLKKNEKLEIFKDSGGDFATVQDLNDILAHMWITCNVSLTTNFRVKSPTIETCKFSHLVIFQQVIDAYSTYLSTHVVGLDRHLVRTWKTEMFLANAGKISKGKKLRFKKENYSLPLTSEDLGTALMECFGRPKVNMIATMTWAV